MNLSSKILGAGLVTLAALTAPVLAQSAAGVQSGPVHVPADWNWRPEKRWRAPAQVRRALDQAPVEVLLQKPGRA